MTRLPAPDLVAGNFEKFCVMEQRGFVSMAFEVPPQETPEGFWREYAEALTAFNRAFEEHEALRSAYLSDIQAQTRAAAVALDNKHDDLTELFLALKPWILKSREEISNSNGR